MILEFDHVQLAMPKVREADAERFYQDLLGFTRVPKPPHLEVRGGCWFECGTVGLRLGVDNDFQPACKAHPGLLVDDLGALISHLIAGGVEVNDDQPLESYLRVYVDDPLGNWIGLMQRVISVTKS